MFKKILKPTRAKIIIFVVLTIITILLIITALSQKPSVTPTPIPDTTKEKTISNNTNTINGYSLSSTFDLERIFGPSTNSTPQDNYLVNNYKSQSPTTPHEAVISGQTIVLLKQTITNQENITKNLIANGYSNQPVLLYGTNQNSGNILYLLPQDGIAYISSETDKFIYEIWYFEPTSTQDFIAEWAPGYSTQPNPSF